MPQDEEEKRKRKEKNKKKKNKRKGGDIFSIFDLVSVLKRRERDFEKKSGVRFKTGEDVKPKN